MADPIRRAEKFIRGLDPHIQMYLIGTPPTTHEAALASVRSWELITEDQRAAQTGTAARRAPLASSAPAASSTSIRTPAAIRTVQTTSFKAGPSSSALSGANRIALFCDHCQKPGHAKPTCRRLLGLCLRCGQAGHMAKDCPTFRAGAPPSQSIQAFALSVEEAEAHGPVAGISCFIISVILFIVHCISS